MRDYPVFRKRMKYCTHLKYLRAMIRLSNYSYYFFYTLNLDRESHLLMHGDCRQNTRIVSYHVCIYVYVLAVRQVE